jgi:hypothetical protein
MLQSFVSISVAKWSDSSSAVVVLDGPALSGIFSLWADRCTAVASLLAAWIFTFFDPFVDALIVWLMERSFSYDREHPIDKGPKIS